MLIESYLLEQFEAVARCGTLLKASEELHISQPSLSRSIVLPCGVIDSPFLGKIPPLYLSGGVKTLILTLFEPNKIFNASTCGDNCAKWFLKIAENEDRTINLRHIMDFGEGYFEIMVLNTDRIVNSQRELVEEAVDVQGL